MVGRRSTQCKSTLQLERSCCRRYHFATAFDNARPRARRALSRTKTFACKTTTVNVKKKCLMSKATCFRSDDCKRRFFIQKRGFLNVSQKTGAYNTQARQMLRFLKVRAITTLPHRILHEETYGGTRSPFWTWEAFY